MAAIDWAPAAPQGRRQRPAKPVPRRPFGRAFGFAGLWRRLAGLFGSLLAMGGAKAIELPENRAEGLYHLYGGGVTADGPALLVRKSIADKVSLSGSYYVDAVSNASIDVVTTASPFKETRKATTSASITPTATR